MRTVVTFILLSLIFGFVVGLVLPKTWQREALREFEARPKNGLYEVYGGCIPPQYWDWEQLDPVGNFCTNLSEVLSSYLDEGVDCVFARIEGHNPHNIKQMDMSQLYVESGLSKKYDDYLISLSGCICRGDFRTAECVAQGAFEVRCSAHYHPADREERFANDLITLGDFAKAKEVIQTLPPVEQAPGERECSAPGRAPFVAYRQLLLGEAYLGMGDHQAALKELRKDV